MSARDKIQRAAEATAKMDDLLLPALAGLSRSISQENGAGIYPDISSVRSALTTAFSAIASAREILRTTDWPTAQDYDAC